MVIESSDGLGAGVCGNPSLYRGAVLDSSEKFLFAAPLGQKTACTDLVCPVRTTRICIHGEDENPCAGELGFDDSSCFNPIENGHTDIHQNDIRSVFFNRLDGSKPMLSLGNDLQARCGFKDAAEGPSIDLAVIGNNNTNR